MISANDVLQVISEIHQFAMLLFEFRDTTTYGILHSSDEKVSYFRFDGKLGHIERNALVHKMSSGEIPESLRPLPVEEFLRGIDKKKARHIWLETYGEQRQELGFLSIAELKEYFRSQSH